MLLNSQIQKIERFGLKINGMTTIDGFVFDVQRNFGRGDHFSLSVRNPKTNEWSTLCTRANIDTILTKAREFLNANK